MTGASRGIGAAAARALDGAGALKFLRTLKTQLETVEVPLY